MISSERPLYGLRIGDGDLFSRASCRVVVWIGSSPCRVVGVGITVRIVEFVSSYFRGWAGRASNSSCSESAVVRSVSGVVRRSFGRAL